MKDWFQDASWISKSTDTQVYYIKWHRSVYTINPLHLLTPKQVFTEKIHSQVDLHSLNPVAQGSTAYISKGMIIILILLSIH